jgi:hypothetical protein
MRLMFWLRAAVCLAAVTLWAGCARSGDSPGTGTESTAAPELLAEGSWSVASREGAHVLLLRNVTVPRTESRHAARGSAPPEVALYEGGCFTQLPVAEVIPITLPGIPPEQAPSLSIARVRLDARDIYFSVPGEGTELRRSPSGRDLYLFEAANG